MPMQTIKSIFNAINYIFYVFYSFTIIDVIKKVTFGEFYLSNATNLVQFGLTVIGLFFGYYKLLAYKRDSKIKSEILEQELIAKKNANFELNWKREFLDLGNKLEDLEKTDSK